MCFIISLSEDIISCLFFNFVQCKVSCLYLHSFSEIILDPLTCSDFSLPYLSPHATYNSLDSLLCVVNFSLVYILFIQLYWKTEDKIVFLPSSLSCTLLSFSLIFFFLWAPQFLGECFVQNRGVVMLIGS